MRKPANIKISPTKGKFSYGECALKAISQAFEIPESALLIIGKYMRINFLKELNFWECQKVIHKLAKSAKSSVEYIPNKTEVTYAQMAFLLSEGKYLAMFDNHLSYLLDGEILDDYIHDPDNPQWMLKRLHNPPTGWWKIRKYSIDKTKDSEWEEVKSVNLEL